MSQGIKLTAKMITDLYEEDVRERKRLAELLLSEPDIRLAIINAVIRDVATKQDIERLRQELRQEIRQEMDKLRQEFRQETERLRQEFRREISRLEERISRLEERVSKLEERVCGLEERVHGLEVEVAELKGTIKMLVKAFFAVNIPILLAMIGILLKLIFMSS